MVCLCIFTWWQYFIGHEISIQLRETVVTAIVSFYFGQKVGEAKKDPLVDKTEKEIEQE